MKGPAYHGGCVGLDPWAPNPLGLCARNERQNIAVAIEINTFVVLH